jgi:hypothetical protein
MAKKKALKYTKERHVGDQDLPSVREPDSSFPANSQQQVVYVAEEQRANNSYDLLFKRGRDTSEVQELRKAGFGQKEPEPKPEKKGLIDKAKAAIKGD